jgi:hypothetical protein
MLPNLIKNQKYSISDNLVQLIIHQTPSIQTLINLQALDPFFMNHTPKF